MSLSLSPITWREAKAWVQEHHRHLGCPAGWLFGVSVVSDGRIVGVAMVGRPVARLFQDGYTCEVTRCCTDGTRNAPSMLYRACWRAARALGYRRLVTYSFPGESGCSLRGANFRLVGSTKGGSWNRLSRPRVDAHPTHQKLLWEIVEVV